MQQFRSYLAVSKTLSRTLWHKYYFWLGTHQQVSLTLVLVTFIGISILFPSHTSGTGCGPVPC